LALVMRVKDSSVTGSCLGEKFPVTLRGGVATEIRRAAAYGKEPTDWFTV